MSFEGRNCGSYCPTKLRIGVPNSSRLAQAGAGLTTTPRSCSWAGDELIMSIAGQVSRALLSRYSHLQTGGQAVRPRRDRGAQARPTRSARSKPNGSSSLQLSLVRVSSSNRQPKHADHSGGSHEHNPNSEVLARKGAGAIARVGWMDELVSGSTQWRVRCRKGTSHRSPSARLAICVGLASSFRPASHHVGWVELREPFGIINRAGLHGLREGAFSP